MSDHEAKLRFRGPCFVSVYNREVQYEYNCPRRHEGHREPIAVQVGLALHVVVTAVGVLDEDVESKDEHSNYITKVEQSVKHVIHIKPIAVIVNVQSRREKYPHYGVNEHHRMRRYGAILHDNGAFTHYGNKYEIDKEKLPCSQLVLLSIVYVIMVVVRRSTLPDFVLCIPHNSR